MKIMVGLEVINLKQNKNNSLKKYYNSVYLKGENKVYTDTDEIKETIKQFNWKNKKVLDVGCGTGLFSYSIAKKGATVTGIDYSEESINIATKRKHKNLTFKNADIHDGLNYKYDVIVSLGTLEHMDNPLKILRIFKKHLKKNGKIIITSPNWTNPRGYFLIILFYLFDAPITLADLHYLTPVDFHNWAKKLDMNLKWKTIDQSWAHGPTLIKDFTRRIPNVLRDAGLPNDKKKIKKFISWIKKNILIFNNSLPHSGATGLYIFS